MRRIVVKEARPGMVVARNAGNGSELPAMGQALTVDHLAALHASGTYDMWVDDPGFEFFEEIAAEQPTVCQKHLAEGLCDSFMRLASCMERTALKRHQLVIEDLVRSIVKGATVIPCLAAMCEDEALLSHSCDVTALSIILGLRLEAYLIEQRPRLDGRRAREIHSLAMGALFHDVGELMLPAGQRESRLTGMLDGHEAWKEHVDEGHAIVHGRLDPSAVAVVVQHHQHVDGSGFGGLAEQMPRRGNGIHVFSRIVTVADLFSQTMFGSGGRIPQPMIKSLWQMQQKPLRSMFDPAVLQCLLGLFPPFVEGMIVTLNDHRQAVVTRVDAAYPCYPEVKTIREGHMVAQADVLDQSETINLADRTDVVIETMDGFPIAPYRFGPRRGKPIAA